MSERRKITVADALELPEAERILFVQDVWDSLAAAPERVPLSPAEERELLARLAAWHADLSAGSPWPEVKERIRKSRR